MPKGLLDPEHHELYLIRPEAISKKVNQGDKRRAASCLKTALISEEPDYEKQTSASSTQSRWPRFVQKWVPAISKEVNNLFDGTLDRITMAEAKRMEAEGLVKILPSKGVFTLKPPSDSNQRFKRKFRLVICGNYAPRGDAEEEMSLYAGGASAETFRIALVVAVNEGWPGATSDVTGAFLLADCLVVAEVCGASSEAFVGVGSRCSWRSLASAQTLVWHKEAPGVWAHFRSKRMAWARIAFKGGHIKLKASAVDPELWFAYDCDGLIITYVDDLFYLSIPEVIEALHAWVEAEWPCSALEWASSHDGTRYLGIVVKQLSDGSYEISQEGYVMDLLRSHDMEQAAGTKLLEIGFRKKMMRATPWRTTRKKS